MTTVAAICGIARGLLGLGIGACVMSLAAIGGALDAPGSGVVGGLGFLTILGAILAIIGGGQARRNTKASLTLFGLAVILSLVGSIGSLMAGVLPAIVYFVGGLLAYFGRDEVLRRA